MCSLLFVGLETAAGAKMDRSLPRGDERQSRQQPEEQVGRFHVPVLERARTLLRSLDRRWASAAITDTLIIMAVAMTLARTVSLAVRPGQIRRYVPISLIAA
ncbi:MAG: hypothetical protein JWN10_1149 [Solirubrobacterales bacterium]|nr:hypothetical protein [Solirubrobacterales bacterium]